MAKRSRSDAFKHFGAAPKNTQWSRSARTPDGKTVIITLWQDKLLSRDKKLTYSHSPDDGWFESPGQKELRDNLIWCEDHCDGLFKVVLVTAKDPKSIPREVESSDPVNSYEMKLTSLDRSNGAFSSMAVPVANNAF